MIVNSDWEVAVAFKNHFGLDVGSFIAQVPLGLNILKTLGKRSCIA